LPPAYAQAYFYQCIKQREPPSPLTMLLEDLHHGGIIEEAPVEQQHHLT
jgi:hypothetical protein